MNIEIKSKQENALLDRTEVRFLVNHHGEATPKRADVREKLAAVVNSKKDLVVVDHMRSQFGRGDTQGYARVYKSIDSLVATERAYLLKRNGLEKYAQKGEAKQEGSA